MPSTGTELLDGLAIMAVGMGVVFGVLIVLLGAIVALTRWFQAEKAAGEVAPLEGTGPPPAEGEGDVVAAISVALARAMADGAAPRGAASASGVPGGGAWRLSGRRRAMESRQGVKGRYGVPGARPGLRRWRAPGGRE